MGEWDYGQRQEEQRLACEVGMVTRDLLELEGVEVEEVYSMVSFERVNRGLYEVGVYTLVALVVVASERDMESDEERKVWDEKMRGAGGLVHKLVFSQYVEGGDFLWRSGLDAILSSQFEKDGRALKVEKFGKNRDGSGVASGVLNRRDCEDVLYRESKDWVGEAFGGGREGKLGLVCV